MDFVDGFVILGTVWSLIGGVYLYVTYTATKARELEEFKQENISLRQQTKPREWWQEILIEMSKRPETFDKVIGMLQNGSLQSLLQQFKR